MDDEGRFAMNLWHPVRIFAYLTNSSSQKTEELEAMAINANKNGKKISADGLVTFSFQGDPVFGTFELKELEEPGLYDLNLSLTKEGKYYLYILINEELIKDMPKLLDISRGNEEERKQQEEAVT